MKGILGDIGNFEIPVFISGSKIGIFPNKHDAVHIFVDGAKHVHAPGLIKRHALFRRIALVKPEVELFGVGHGKDVVIDIIVVWPFDGRPDHRREYMRGKGRPVIRGQFRFLSKRGKNKFTSRLLFRVKMRLLRVNNSILLSRHVNHTGELCSVMILNPIPGNSLV